ncbi:ABC transporter permease [Metabacillus sp. RGM 3146]|uniref:ABC transporter permease n=1 Tax=Metabacillus sp. RGM 3146 TaxID=3401092 RepID=UPI003B9CBDB9
MNAFLMQCKAEIKRLLRNRYYVGSSLLMPILFYTIFTRVVNTDAPNMKEWQAHYLMSMAAFSVMGSGIMTLGIRTVQERTQGWSLFMLVTPLPGSLYFLAKMVAQSVIHALSITVIFCAGALINGVTMPVHIWLLSGLWILFASFTFMALGTLIGTMKRVDTAIGVSNLLYMGMAVTGGLWMPFDILPSLMQQIGRWLPSYSFANGAWQLAAQKYPDLSNLFLLAAYAVLFVILSSYIRKKQEAA